VEWRRGTEVSIVGVDDEEVRARRDQQLSRSDE